MAQTSLETKVKDLQGMVDSLEVIEDSKPEEEKASKILRAQIEELKDIVKCVQSLVENTEKSEAQLPDINTLKTQLQDEFQQINQIAQTLNSSEQKKITRFQADLDEYLLEAEKESESAHIFTLVFARSSAQILKFFLIKNGQVIEKKDYDAITRELEVLKTALPGNTLGRILAGIVTGLLAVAIGFIECLSYPIDKFRGQDFSWSKSLANYSYRMFHSPLQPPLDLIEEKLEAHEGDNVSISL